MKIKTNLFAVAHFNSENGTWYVPGNESLLTKSEIKEFGGKKAVLKEYRRMSHRRVKLLRQVFVK